MLMSGPPPPPHPCVWMPMMIPMVWGSFPPSTFQQPSQQTPLQTPAPAPPPSPQQQQQDDLTTQLVDHSYNVPLMADFNVALASFEEEEEDESTSLIELRLFTKVEVWGQHQLRDVTCSICQLPFAANQVVRRLACGHRYHINCVDQWLEANSNCPYCRTAIITSRQDSPESSPPSSPVPCPLETASSRTTTATRRETRGSTLATSRRRQ